jgi:integrase
VAHIQKHKYKSKRTGQVTIKWQARYTTPDGRERTRRFDRKIDAERWLDTNCADIARGSWVDPSAGRVTLGAYANEWLEARTDLRSTTMAKYRGLLNRHIIPAFGPTPIGRLGPSDVRSWHSALHRKHPSTAAGAYRLLATICRTAVDDDLISRSPCRVKGAATEQAHERPTATVLELQAVVNAVPLKYQPAVLLAAWCQLRRSEVLGLQRGDVDMATGILSVERTWVQPEGGGHEVGLPKTEAGRRRVAIPHQLLPILEVHLRTLGPQKDAWLFPGNDGHPISTRTLDRTWSKARTMIDRPDLRFHDVRHSGLTLVATTGATVAEIMRRGGHGSPAAALRYQHASDDRDKALADALAHMASATTIDRLPATSNAPTEETRKTSAVGEEVEATITPLTSTNTEQSQRGSNPCLHLERVVS